MRLPWKRRKGPTPQELLAEALRAQAEETRQLRDEVEKQRQLTESKVSVGLREAHRILADAMSAELGRQTRRRLDGDEGTAQA